MEHTLLDQLGVGLNHSLPDHRRNTNGLILRDDEAGAQHGAVALHTQDEPGIQALVRQALALLGVDLLHLGVAAVTLSVINQLDPSHQHDATCLQDQRQVLESLQRGLF